MSTQKMLREFIRAVRSEFDAHVDIKRDNSSHHKLTVTLPSGAIVKLTASSSPRDEGNAVRALLREVRRAVLTSTTES